jgi:serine/threonine protein kinase
MGTVFRARHRRMNRLVALKVLSKDVVGTAALAQRFQREVETIARMSHPNIVMAHDADEGPAGPFLVMEFVNGRDLASDVQKQGPLSVDDAVDCILQSARGLEYAHGQGIVHRDIKPGNILRDASGVIKVADLGLARLSESGSSGGTSLTQAGNVVGTVDYMPPEQAVDSTAIDHRADIYSLGCTLYLLLTGKPPYSGSSLMAVLLAHRDVPIPSLRAKRPDVPPELEAIFHRMVEKQREARFNTMAEVAAALEQLKRIPLSHDRPGVAKPATTTGTMEFSSGELAPNRDTSKENLGGNVSQTLVSGVAGMTVVLVEPSRAQAGIIRRYLEQLGVVVAHVTGSGQDALAAARTHRANALFSAMHLSDMTAVDLVAALNADASCSGIGFVLATSESDGDLTAALPPRNSLVILSKPFDVKKVSHAMEAARRSKPPA